MSETKISKDDYSNHDKPSRVHAEGKKSHTRVYVHKNSILTDMLEANQLGTPLSVFHIVVLFLVVFTIFYYRADPSKLKADLDFLKWSLTPFPYAILFILLFHAFAFGFYEGFKLWVDVRSRFQSKVVDEIVLFLYVPSFVLTFSITGYCISILDLRPIFGLALVMEQMRIHMKIYSFVRECSPRVLQHKPEKDGSQEHFLYPSRKHYCYFLFAPVLLYRDTYPRTEKTHWNNVLFNAFQFSLCVVLLYCTILRFLELFVNVGLRPFTPAEEVFAHAAASLIAVIGMFSLSYGLLHSWLNMFAEILRFGDREFYGDWWTSNNQAEHFRKWNVVVRDWFSSYVYEELQRLGYSHNISRIGVFVASSLFHDYGSSLSLGFIFPVFGLNFAIAGIVVFPLTRGKKGLLWKTITLFCSLLLSQICAYHWSVEYYARINCPKNETFMDFFIPRIFDPSCQTTPLFKFLRSLF